MCQFRPDDASTYALPPPHMHVRSSSRNTFGEALVALAGLAGMMIAVREGIVDTRADLWFFALMFVMTVLFYFGLLLARMLFFWMTGGDASAWWENRMVLEDAAHHPKTTQKTIVKR